MQSSSSLSGGVIVGETFTDPRDGQVYRIVTIGPQTWFAENLKYNVQHSRCYGEDGTIENEAQLDYTTTLTNEEVAENCAKYGRLYDWATALNLRPLKCNFGRCADEIQPKHRGICPVGWRIPTDDDWQRLLHYVDGSDGDYIYYPQYIGYSETAGKYLKTTNNWNDYRSSSGNGTDKYGFSALPGGYAHYTNPNKYSYLGMHGYWWNTREPSEKFPGIQDMANTYMMYHHSDNACSITTLKVTLNSVRCIQGDGGNEKYLSVAFDTDGGIPANISSVSVDSGAVLWSKYPADPTKSGYTFGGWFDSDKLYTSLTAITKNVTLKAKWNKLGDGGVFEDSRDGQSYNTILMGGNRWMAQNLNYITDNSWCYDDNDSNCETYGRLYAWDIAMDVACPSGWRLPNESDWNNLIQAVGNDGVDFPKMLGGYRESNGSFLDIGNSGVWLSATLTNITIFDPIASKTYIVPMVFQMSNEAKSISRGYHIFKEDGASVRCVEGE